MSPSATGVDRLVVSCEHGGNRVPRRYAAWFLGGEAALGSHRGYDPGALALARRLARAAGAPLHYATTTRLLVELNRSVTHRDLFSPFVAGASREEKERIIRRYYRPYRDRITKRIAGSAARGLRTLHVGVHSFTPVWEGREREIDVALLYDPARPLERAVCGRWLAALRDSAPDLRLRRNAPYRGTDDGLTTHLRRTFAPDVYLGVELEVSQELLAPGARARRRVSRVVEESLRRVLAGEVGEEEGKL